MKTALGARILWGGAPPRDAWHSFDRTPWRHPWLTDFNLRRARRFGDAVLAQAAAATGTLQSTDQYGFVCNLANSMYERAVGLRKRDLNIVVFPHPQDRYVMSHPEWEDFDGVLESREVDIDTVRARVSLPQVHGVENIAPDAIPSMSALQTVLKRPPGVRPFDALRWTHYTFANATLLRALQRMDALLVSQAPYLAFLSGRPYVAAQIGGEIWYECARDDHLGRLQRAAYSAAHVFIVSNPWSYAHARRYGLHRLVYLPMILDEDVYAPAPSRSRAEWEARTKGDFFVLCTARMDDYYKGTGMALAGFARFAASHPGARLVTLRWGSDRARNMARLAELGIADRVLELPLSGKRRVVDYLRASDCLLDQFVLGYYGATAMEAMACAIPVVMRLEKTQYDALCNGGAPPVLDCRTEGEVAAALDGLARDRPARRALGEAHRSWFLDNHSAARWALAYTSLLAATARRLKFNWRASPLREPLTPEERAYHAEELCNAPKFPSYQ